MQQLRLIRRHRALVFAAAWLLLLRAPEAQAQRAGPEYLSAELRARVQQLKDEAQRTPTDLDTLGARAKVTWDWLNAFALSGGAVPPNSTTPFQTIFKYAERVEMGRDTSDINMTNRAGGIPLAVTLDELIYELALKDEQPDALGPITVTPSGPFEARSMQTIVQTYTVGSMPLTEGAVIMLGKQLMANYGVYQGSDPSAPNYVTLASSNSEAEFTETRVPLSGMHGGFRAPAPTHAWRLESGELTSGETITITFGDRSGGSPGFRMQTFQNDAVLFPIYIDPDGKGVYLTPVWQSYSIEGTVANAVRGFAPSIVKAGEPFELAIRSEDFYFNRATGRIPAYDIDLNGEPWKRTSEDEALSILSDIRLDEPGVYRFGIRSADGRLTGSSNPVWVREDPEWRLYWGETHAHTGMAEGQGTIDGFYRYGRDEARLDFLGLSEHDIWLEDNEWRVMREAVERYTEPGKFIAYLGYEWTVRRQYGGHHNVFFRSTDMDRVPAQTTYNLSRLYEDLRAIYNTDDVLIIPHAHQAADWRQSDPEMERVVEIMSNHGTFEWFGNYYLQRGHQVGFIAASDDHRSRPGYAGTIPRAPLAQFGGLAAVWAPEKTSDAIFNALRERRAYATTSGERVIVDFTINGATMGVRTPRSRERRISLKVMGTAGIDSIDIIKNGRIIHGQRYSAAPLRSRSTVEVAFESSSEPFGRDNPRPYRRWPGTIEVSGAKLIGLSTPNFDNRHIEFAEIDARNPQRVRFHTETRGRADLLRLELEQASSSTEVVINLDASQEYGAAPVLRRGYKDLPAERLRFPFSDLSDSRLTRELPVGKHTDTVTVSLVDPEIALDRSIEFVDAENPGDGDYYYARVTQTNGARAWSSPIWIGGEQPR